MDRELIVIKGLYSDPSITEHTSVILSEELFSQANKARYRFIADYNLSHGELKDRTPLSMLRAMEQVGIIMDNATLVDYITAFIPVQEFDMACKLLHEEKLRSDIGRLGVEIAQKAQDPTQDVFDLYEYYSDKFSIDMNKILDGSDLPISSYVVDVITLMTSPVVHKGLLTNIYAIDNFLYGLRRSNVYVIAARPSVGKSAFALNIAHNVSATGAKTLFMSLEMDTNQLIERLIKSVCADNSGVNNAEAILNAGNIIYNLPLIIDDRAYCSLDYIRMKVKKIKPELLIIDYLQLIDTSKIAGNRTTNDIIAQVSKGIKAIAKEANIPIILLSQLSRDIEKRKEAEPVLSDLRDSGGIEQDADVVMFLRRPELEDKPEVSIGGETFRTEGLALLYCRKNRQGSVFSTKLSFDKERTLFTNYNYTNLQSPY